MPPSITKPHLISGPIAWRMPSSDTQPINYLILGPKKARGMVKLGDRARLGNILVILLAKEKKTRLFLPR